MDKDQRQWEGFELKTEGGRTIPCSAGISINEFGPIGASCLIEVTCCGIADALYNELFPEHVKAYNSSFKSL